MENENKKQNGRPPKFKDDNAVLISLFIPSKLKQQIKEFREINPGKGYYEFFMEKNNSSVIQKYNLILEKLINNIKQLFNFFKEKSKQIMIDDNEDISFILLAQKIANMNNINIDEIYNILEDKK